MVNRASGTPERLGSSHASRLTSTMTLGGKAGWTPASRCFLEARKPFFKEAFPPLANDLASEVEPRSDDIVTETGRGQKDDFRANDVPIRRRIRARARLQDRPLVASERDEKGASSRHQMWSAAERNVP